MNFGNNKYVHQEKDTQGAKQYWADKIVREQRFEKYLQSLSKQQRTSKERAEKNIMLETGIFFAFLGANEDILECLPEEIKKHRFFNVGIEVGKRRLRILGSNCYLYGMAPEEFLDIIKNNDEFKLGYSEAEKKHPDLAVNKRRLLRKTNLMND